jgi:hypothetical protein
MTLTATKTTPNLPTDMSLTSEPQYVLYHIEHAQRLRTEESLTQIARVMQSRGIAIEMLYVWYPSGKYGKYDTVDSKVYRATSTDPLSQHPEAQDVLDAMWPHMGTSGMVVKYPTPTDPHLLAEAVQQCLTDVECTVLPRATTSQQIDVTGRTITVTSVYIKTTP